jgi:hypothetical protein
MMINESDVIQLQNTPEAIIDARNLVGFEQMVRNNFGRVSNKRTLNQVQYDTASGFGLEDYFTSTGLFVPANPIYENPNEHPWSEIAVDLYYGSECVQVKSFTHLSKRGDMVWISPATYDSIKKSTTHNDFFLFGFTKGVKPDRDNGSTTFKYRPAFSIASSVILNFIQANIEEHSLAVSLRLILDRDLLIRPKYFQPLCPELMKLVELAN